MAALRLPKAAPPEAGPSTAVTNGHAHKCATDAASLRLFLREPTPKGRLLCVTANGDMSVEAFWERFVSPVMGGGGPPAGARLMCAGRTIDPASHHSLRSHGINSHSTLSLAGRLHSQGFSQLHQLMEHLSGTLAPLAAPAQAATGGTAPPVAEDPPALLAREPIMLAIEGQVEQCRSTTSMRDDGDGPGSRGWPCGCMSCTRRPNSTLWLCGNLLHSTDAAVVNLTFRVVNLLLRSRADCPAPVVAFNEQSGALTLMSDDASDAWL